VVHRAIPSAVNSRPASSRCARTPGRFPRACASRARSRCVLPEAEQGLAQALPGLALAGVGPQQRGQLLATVLPPARQTEIGEEGLGLPGRQGERRARADTGLESTEQREGQAYHGLRLARVAIAPLAPGVKETVGPAGAREWAGWTALALGVLTRLFDAALMATRDNGCAPGRLPGRETGVR